MSEDIIKKNIVIKKVKLNNNVINVNDIINSQQIKNITINKIEEIDFSNDLNITPSVLRFKYINFIDIFASLVSTPSSLFFIIFLLPVFSYIIYFICDTLSYRYKNKK